MHGASFDDGWQSRMRASRKFDADEILPGLWLGSHRASSERNELREHGITGIVNVSADLPCVFQGEKEEEGGLRYLRVPVQDWETEHLLPYFESCCDFIETILHPPQGPNGKHGGVLVHCHGGISRSTTVAVAYMMWKDRTLDREEALTIVKWKRRCVDPSDGFCEQLDMWHEHLKMGTKPSETVMGADDHTPPDEGKRCMGWLHRSKAMWLMDMKERAFEFGNGMLLPGRADIPAVLVAAFDLVLGTECRGEKRSQEWLVELYKQAEACISLEDTKKVLLRTLLCEEFLDRWKHETIGNTLVIPLCARVLAVSFPEGGAEAVAGERGEFVHQHLVNQVLSEGARIAQEERKRVHTVSG